MPGKPFFFVQWLLRWPGLSCQGSFPFVQSPWPQYGRWALPRWSYGIRYGKSCCFEDCCKANSWSVVGHDAGSMVRAARILRFPSCLQSFTSGAIAQSGVPWYSSPRWSLAIFVISSIPRHHEFDAHVVQWRVFFLHRLLAASHTVQPPIKVPRRNMQEIDRPKPARCGP